MPLQCDNAFQRMCHLKLGDDHSHIVRGRFCHSPGLHPTRHDYRLNFVLMHNVRFSCSFGSDEYSTTYAYSSLRSIITCFTRASFE